MIIFRISLPLLGMVVHKHFADASVWWAKHDNGCWLADGLITATTLHTCSISAAHTLAATLMTGWQACAC